MTARLEAAEGSHSQKALPWLRAAVESISKANPQSAAGSGRAYELQREGEAEQRWHQQAVCRRQRAGLHQAEATRAPDETCCLSHVWPDLLARSTGSSIAAGYLAPGS